MHDVTLGLFPPTETEVWLQEPQFLQVLEDADIDIHNKATFPGDEWIMY